MRAGIAQLVEHRLPKPRVAGSIPVARSNEIKMFLFKKIVGPFFFPLSLCLEIFIIGLILLWFTKKIRTGKVVILIGVILLTFLSYDVSPKLLLKPLEHQYPPILELKDLPKVKWIIVLSGGYDSDPKIPMNSQLFHASLSRLVEGIRLHHLIPGSKLILSGGALFDPVPEAEIMANIAQDLGVSREKMILESVSRDTEDQAGLIQKFVGNDRFILVTSAAHMPRSMALFKKLGMQPIPAPTDYRVRKKQGDEINPKTFFPQVDELEKTTTAIYEYLGLAWTKLRGRI